MKPLAPAVHFPAELLLQAQAVRAVFFDVDGVLTDGGLYISEQGESLKRFHSLDGHGLKLLQRAGFTIAVISGRDSPALRERLRAQGITHMRLGTEDKLPAAQALLDAWRLDWSQAAAMGDDWPDVPVLRRSAFAAAPARAHPQALALADWVTRARGGEGAVREFCDLLLTAGGHYARLLAQLDPGVAP